MENQSPPISTTLEVPYLCLTSLFLFLHHQAGDFLVICLNFSKNGFDIQKKGDFRKSYYTETIRERKQAKFWYSMGVGWKEALWLKVSMQGLINLYWSWDKGCYSLNENGPHGLLCLNILSPVDGTFGEGLICVALMKEMCHWGWVLKIQKSTPFQVAAFCLLLRDKDISSHLWFQKPWLPVCYHAPCHNSHDLPSETQSPK